MSLAGPNIAKVKTRAIELLIDETTSQAIVIVAQGNKVSICVSVGDGTRKTWAETLHSIADEIEHGESVDDSDTVQRTLS